MNESKIKQIVYETVDEKLNDFFDKFKSKKDKNYQDFLTTQGRRDTPDEQEFKRNYWQTVMNNRKQDFISKHKDMPSIQFKNRHGYTKIFSDGYMCACLEDGTIDYDNGVGFIGYGLSVDNCPVDESDCIKCANFAKKYISRDIIDEFMKKHKPRYMLNPELYYEPSFYSLKKKEEYNRKFSPKKTVNEEHIKKIVSESVKKALHEGIFGNRAQNNNNGTIHTLASALSTVCTDLGEIYRLLSQNNINGAKQKCQQAYKQAKGQLNNTAMDGNRVTQDYGAQNQNYAPYARQQN